VLRVYYFLTQEQMPTDVKVGERYNLNIKKWGSAGWVYLTAAVLQYPENPSDDDKTQFKSFLTTNGSVIPCGLCRKHYKKNLEKHPLTDMVMSSRRNLADWINTIHNEVNISNNKPEYGVLSMIADYMPPTMARSMLKDDQEYEKLKALDVEKNKLYLQSMVVGVAKSQYQKEDGGCVNRWWFWIILVILVIILVLFISSMIKTACKKKSTTRQLRTNSYYSK
jgi:hypothetical protein